MYIVLVLVRTDGDMSSAFGRGFAPSSNCVIAFCVIFVVVNGTSIVSFDPRKPTEPRRVTNVPFPS